MASPRAERGGLARLVAAWRRLAREQRLVVAAAAVLLATMLLPWYSRSVDAVVRGRIETASSSKLAITVFSLVEAAIFVVAVGVVALVLARGDRRAFHLPGGDGTIVAAAGAWATFLIFFRFVDKPSGGGSGQLQIEYGLSWGIFFGLLAALALAAAGLRLRAAQIAEPALAGDVAPSDAARHEGRAGHRRPARASAEGSTRQRPRPSEAPTTVRPRPGEEPTVERPRPSEAPTTVRPFGEPPAFEAPEYQPSPPRPPE